MSATDHFETFVDDEGEHRWRLQSANGKIVATATQGHRDETDASRGILDMLRTALNAVGVPGLEGTVMEAVGVDEFLARVDAILNT